METTTLISEPKRLTRPSSDRWLAGVCAGLGDYFDLSPAIYRIAFVALALAGGTGVLLYLAAWLVIPEEGAEDSIAATALRERRESPRRLLGLGVLAFLFIVAVSQARVWPGAGNLWLVVAIVLAALIWWRLRRGGIARVLGILAIVLAIAAIVIPLATIRVPLFAGAGSRDIAPALASQVHSKYRLGIGRLTLDFSGLTVPRGETFVKATVGIGNLRVVVPQNVTVNVDARVDAGDVLILDREDSGTRVHSQIVDRTGSGRVLVLDLRAGYGKVEVARG